jgi:aspartate aminotransferase-like enzyme
MLRGAALEACRAAKSTSFSVDLGRWLAIMEAYLDGGHAYHATMPTDPLRGLRDAMREAESVGFERLCDAQWELGRAVRASLARRGVRSVAAEGFGAPGVVVAFTDDPDVQNGRKFAAEGLQIAAGVPLMLDEGAGYRSFRIGLFGLDKLGDVAASVARLDAAFDKVFPATTAGQGALVGQD